MNPDILYQTNPSMFPGITGPLIFLFAFLLISLLIFLILRALMLWYWKIDKIVALLQSIDTKLSRLPESAKSEPASKASEPILPVPVASGADTPKKS